MSYLKDLFVNEAKSALSGHKSGGGAGVTSWNDLKDKPFYEESERMEIISNLTSEHYNQVLDQDGSFKLQRGFVVGNRYDVEWNGEHYDNLVCRWDEEARHLCIGGGAYPFEITNETGVGLRIYCDSTFTMSIYTTQETTRSIDQKFIPAPSWDELKNKPFGEMKRDDIYFDGCVNGMEQLSEFEIFSSHYKLYDEPISLDELIGSELGCRYNNEMHRAILDETTLFDMSENLGLPAGSLISEPALASFISVCVDAELKIDEETSVTFKKGFYVLVECFSYIKFPKTIKPLDEKFMPTLTSPSGKKFKLSVDDNGAISATEVT